MPEERDQYIIDSLSDYNLIFLFLEIQFKKRGKYVLNTLFRIIDA